MASIYDGYSKGVGFLTQQFRVPEREKVDAAVISNLKLAQHSFCHSLLVNGVNKASPDSRDYTGT